MTESVLQLVHPSWRLCKNALYLLMHCQVAAVPPQHDKCTGEAVGMTHDHHMLLLAGQQARLGQEKWPHQGHLQFCAVSLCYGRGLPDALDGVSFELRPGQKVGVCGRTGQPQIHPYTPSKHCTGLFMTDSYGGIILPLHVLRSK